MENDNKIKIGLIGLGTVGSGVFKTLRGFNHVEIVKIAVKNKNKKRNIEGLDENIITDRHFLSNYAWSGTDDNTEVYDLLVKKLGFPDLTVILYADETAIFNRLRSRDEHDSDLDKVKKSKEKYEKMVFFCEKYKMPYMVVDTSNLTPDQTVDLIMKRIEGRA